jgi:nicotinamidase-related amidase
MKVLIIVDVQNCFIMKGSLGNNEADMTMMREIESMIKDGGYDMVVFTRDAHPPNHQSFATYPDHCRDMSKTKCPKTITKKVPTIKDTLEKSKTIGQLTNISDSTIASKPVIGTDLSYLYYQTSVHQIVFNPHYIIKKTDSSSDILDNNSAKRTIARTFTYVMKKPTVVHILKGEYCDSDAYSAFNYHIKYSGDTSSPEIELQTSIKYSTGLIEMIFDELSRSDNKKLIEIDICGLAGNICVMHTFVHGSALFKQILTGKVCDSENVLYEGKPYHFNNINGLSVRLSYNYIRGTRFLAIPGILGNFSKNRLDLTNDTDKFILDYINTELKKNDEFKNLKLIDDKNQSDGKITIHLDQKTCTSFNYYDYYPVYLRNKQMYSVMGDLYSFDNPFSIPVSVPITVKVPIKIPIKVPITVPVTHSNQTPEPLI